MTREGRPLPPPPYRSQTLLAAVLLNPLPSRREALAGHFFPDLPEAAAKARLSDRLWLLRSHLPDFPFRITPVEISFEAARVRVDVQAFRELAGEEDPACLLEAVRLYAGPLLPQHYDDWLLVERENLHLVHTRCLHRLASGAMQRQEYELAVPLLEKLQAVEPYDESGLRGLLRAYQALGRRGLAIQAYERFAARLRSEMDLEPEPATREVAEAIRSQEAPPRPAGDDDTCGASPEDRLRSARLALWQGDLLRLRPCLDGLPQTLPEDVRQEREALEIEAALQSGEIDSARRRLEGFPAPLPLRLASLSVRLAVDEKEFETALTAGRALLQEAHRRRDLPTQVSLLLDLGLANQRTGNAGEAARCASQAISLAEKAGLPYLLARSYQLKGILTGGQGFDREAIRELHQAAALAREGGFRPLLARVERHLGSFYQVCGKYRQSLQHYDEALAIARDLGLLREEAETLQNRAVTLSSLGRGREGIASIETARRLIERLDDELALARNTYHLAYDLAFLEQPDLDRVLDMARQALAIFEKRRYLGWIASSHSLLAYTHWLRGEPEPAIQACREAIRLFEQLDEFDTIPELNGYIGLCLLDQGQPEQALAYTTQAMEGMFQSELYDIAGEVYYAHSSALAALGREAEVGESFARGYEVLLGVAQEIEEGEARQAFFRRDPTVRRLMAQVYARGIAAPPQTVTRVVASPGRAAVRVALTVDAGAPDQALKNASGMVALRRERLQRLLEEARRQGGKPSLSQMAEWVGVSLRTLQRDLAASREPGDQDPLDDPE